MKNLLPIIMLFVTTISFAQDGLYQTIEKNGEAAEYREYYSVMKGEKEGTTSVEGERYWVNAVILKTESGEKYGVKFVKTDGSGDLRTLDFMSRYNKVKGYPNVSYIYHEKENDGLIAVGDYIMVLNGISSDGLSFKSFETVFVKKQVKEVKKEADTGKDGKKKSKFLASLKDALLSGNSSDESNSIEAKKARSEDLTQIAKDYLKAIKAKQSTYTLTAQDNADIAKLEALKAQKYADIKKANDDYWASPAGQAHYKSYGNSSSKSSSYTVKNTSSSAVTIGGNGWTYLLNAGSSKTISCNSAVFRMVKNGSSWQTGSQISNGSKCGQTISF
ncbi:MAG: hypothetical protein ACPGVH_08900 [Chitinophagales bacterium]